METKGPNEVGREQLRIGRSLALLLLCAGALPLTAQSRDAGLVTLPHHVIGNLSDSSRLPHTLQMEQDPIRLTVVLNLSDEAARDAFADDLENPDSPNYHSIISLSEFTSRFGPTQQAYDAVLAYLRQNGFTLERGSDNRRTLTVNGKRAQAEHAFKVAIEDFRLGDRTFHAITSDPAVPAALAPLIATVAGLSNKAVWTPADQPNPPFPASSATAYNGSLTPAGKTNAGGLPPGLDGTGQTIGLIEFGNFYTSDVENWLKHVGLPSTNIQHLYTATINAESPCYCNSSKEVLLDIAAVMGIAPGADVIVFLASFALYPDENLDDAINLSAQYLIQHEPGRGTLSLSWNECEGDVNSSEETTLDGMLKDYATMGVTLFAATGDHGSTCVGKGNNAIPNTISYPAGAPHTVAVGGTGLSVNADNSYLVENWWGFNGGSSAGGFGVSRFAPQPGYQAPLYRGQAFRSVPDVSIEATPGIAVCQATATTSPNCNPVGGTSLGAPLWAGIWALGGQASVDAGGNTQTASNGFLYRFPGTFHAPSTMTGPDNDFQHVGLGSPDVTKLIAITNPPRVGNYSPTSGPANGGTKVTINGAGFIGVDRVTFGGVAATDVTIDSDTQLTAVSPIASNSQEIVEVNTPGGTAVAAVPFTYVTPAIRSVNPRSGPLQGETEVTVTGTLGKGYLFTFGGALATNVSCSSTQCTMVTPAHDPGPVAVVVKTPSGAVSATLDNGFTYQALSLSSFTPGVGPTTGDFTVEIFGTSLKNNMTVSFGGANATSIDCSSDGTGCYLFAPAHAAGLVSVTASASGHTATAPAQFSYQGFPTITGISPTSGKPGTAVKLTGTGFGTTPGSTYISFDGSTGPAGACESTTTCGSSVPFLTGVSSAYLVVTVVVNGNASQGVGFEYYSTTKPIICNPKNCQVTPRPAPKP